MESLSSQQDSASDFHSAIDTLSEQDEGTVTPPSKQATPATSPQSSFRWHHVLVAAQPRHRSAGAERPLHPGEAGFAVVTAALSAVFRLQGCGRWLAGGGAPAGEAEEDPGGVGDPGLWWEPVRDLCGESGGRQSGQRS